MSVTELLYEDTKILNQVFRRFLKQKLVLKRVRVKIFEIIDSIFI